MSGFEMIASGEQILRESIGGLPAPEPEPEPEEQGEQ